MVKALGCAILAVAVGSGTSVLAEHTKLECSGKQKELRECDSGECPPVEPIDCEWSPWSEWGPCECDGLQERHRGIAVHNNEVGKACTGEKVETKTCKPTCHKDPIDCKLGEWGGWNDCSATCGGGQTFRTREIETESAYGGKPCTGDLKEIGACMMEKPCHKPQDCVLTEWAEWGRCSKSCGGGEKERTRNVEINADYGGKLCDTNMREVTACNEDLCEDPVDCVWAEWQDWSACSKSCGGGQRELLEILLFMRAYPKRKLLV